MGVVDVIVDVRVVYGVGYCALSGPGVARARKSIDSDTRSANAWD